MDELQHKLEHFFQTRAIDRALYSAGSLHGTFEEVRIHSLQKIYPSNIERFTDANYKGISGDVYRIHMDGLLSAIIVVYPDEDILWLDDHINNLDYERFIAKEQLLQWIPDRIDRFVEVLVTTKFAYLGQPHSLHKVSDIELKPTSVIDRLSQSEDGQIVLKEEDTKLNNLAKRIHPPEVQISSDKRVTLTMFVWTRIRGKVFEIECIFLPNGKFIYSGIELADMIGQFIFPR